MLRILGMLALLILIYLFAHDGNPGTATGSLTKIEEILSTPRAFDGKTVTVQGLVTGSLGLMGIGGYHLRDLDGQREVFVLSAGGVPPSGSTVTISGIFREAVTINGSQWPVVLLKP